MYHDELLAGLARVPSLHVDREEVWSLSVIRMIVAGSHISVT